MTLEDAINITKGCFSFRNHKPEGGDLQIFHHGIRVVLEALEEARDKSNAAKTTGLINLGKGHSLEICSFRGCSKIGVYLGHVMNCDVVVCEKHKDQCHWVEDLVARDCPD